MEFERNNSINYQIIFSIKLVLCNKYPFEFLFIKH